MAVRCVMIRSECVLFHVKRILNEQICFQKADMRKLHCYRSRRFFERYSNLQSRQSDIKTLLTSVRYSSRDGNEQIPNPSEVWCPENVKSNSTANTQRTSEAETEQVTLDYFKGLPRITVPLPSRKERCRFTLKPVVNTVGDLSAKIKAEDPGIDRVTISGKDGIRIASSNSIELLLEEDEFYITINDVRYKINIPSTLRKSFNKEDMEKLSDIRMLVSQLHASLNVEEYRVHEEEKLKAKLEKLRAVLEPLEEKRIELQKKAERRSSYLMFIYLGGICFVFGILARLTWWEYSWDIMEPVTYFVTLSGYALSVFFYLTSRKEFILPDVEYRYFLKAMHKNAKKFGLDIEQYNSLKEQFARVEADLEQLQDQTKSSSSSSSSPSHSKYTSSSNNAFNNIDTLKPSDNVKRWFQFLLNKARKFK